MSRYSEEDFETKKSWRKERKRVSAKDRSKYKKTDLDKHKKRDKQELSRKLEKKNLQRGRVLAIFPEEISIQYDDRVVSCVLKGGLKQEITQMKNLVTIGDFVLFDPQDGSIHHVQERYSFLSRKEHGRKQQQLIAANIDQALIVVSVMEPPLKPALVDRYIISSLKGRMTPIIVVNKIDLLEPNSQELNLFKYFLNTYRDLQIKVLAVSAKTKEGVDALKEQMKDKASVFSGQSGVGKSSLINMITKSDLPIGKIIKKTKKGTHTTSQAHLIPLDFGGWCIDTPGIRSFGIWDLKKEDLDLYFDEITEKAQGCKYPNCSHCHEPECKVKAAVEKEEISLLRFESYLKLLPEVK